MRLPLQGTHVKFIAEREPTMASIIQQQLQEQQLWEQQQLPGLRSRL